MIKQHKVVAALPSVLAADSVYYVRVGDGFEQYVTNSTGTLVAYQQNVKLQLNQLSDRVEALEGGSVAAQYTPAYRDNGTMIKLMHVTAGVLAAQRADGTTLNLQVANNG